MSPAPPVPDDTVKSLDIVRGAAVKDHNRDGSTKMITEMKNKIIKWFQFWVSNVRFHFWQRN